MNDLSLDEAKKRLWAEKEAGYVGSDYTKNANGHIHSPGGGAQKLRGGGRSWLWDRAERFS